RRRLAAYRDPRPLEKGRGAAAAAHRRRAGFPAEAREVKHVLHLKPQLYWRESPDRETGANMEESKCRTLSKSRARLSAAWRLSPAARRSLPKPLSRQPKPR